MTQTGIVRPTDPAIYHSPLPLKGTGSPCGQALHLLPREDRPLRLRRHKEAGRGGRQRAESRKQSSNRAIYHDCTGHNGGGTGG
jgi:hypothetical protein